MLQIRQARQNLDSMNAQSKTMQQLDASLKLFNQV